MWLSCWATSLRLVRRDKLVITQMVNKIDNVLVVTEADVLVVNKRDESLVANRSDHVLVVVTEDGLCT
jgi:hypothetical protein